MAQILMIMVLVGKKSRGFSGWVVVRISNKTGNYTCNRNEDLDLLIYQGANVS